MIVVGIDRLGRAVLDLVLPPRCLSCEALIGTSGGVCAGCWRDLSFIEGSLCARCGFPFPYEQDGEALCGACSASPPAYRRGRAALAYDDSSRRLILPFKHSDKLHGAKLFATWMSRAGVDLFSEADLIVPVPLHWTRLFTRRYNQAAVLSIAVGRLTGMDVAADLLVRRRRTPTQGGLGATARRRNVQGAFAVRKRRVETVRGAHVLLVDDVLTTGATAESCARVLYRSGAASVDVLCLARVVREAHLV